MGRSMCDRRRSVGGRLDRVDRHLVWRAYSSTGVAPAENLGVSIHLAAGTLLAFSAGFVATSAFIALFGLFTPQER